MKYYIRILSLNQIKANRIEELTKRESTIVAAIDMFQFFVVIVPYLVLSVLGIITVPTFIIVLMLIWQFAGLIFTFKMSKHLERLSEQKKGLTV